MKSSVFRPIAAKSLNRHPCQRGHTYRYDSHRADVSQSVQGLTLPANRLRLVQQEKIAIRIHSHLPPVAGWLPHSDTTTIAKLKFSDPCPGGGDQCFVFLSRAVLRFKALQDSQQVYCRKQQKFVLHYHVRWQSQHLTYFSAARRQDHGFSDLEYLEHP